MKKILLLALLGLLAGGAQAAAADVKKLAQFDLGFARCEALFPHMKGHTDEAYLGLWKIQPNDKRRAELGKLRKTPAYKQALERARKAMATSTPELDEKVKQQCEATWAEAQANKPKAGK